MEIVDNNKVLIDLYFYHDLITELTLLKRERDINNNTIYKMSEDLKNKDKLIESLFELIKK